MDTYIERKKKTGMQRFTVLSRELDDEEKSAIAELRFPGGVVRKFFDLYLEQGQQALALDVIKAHLDLRSGAINSVTNGVNSTLSYQDIQFVLLYEGYVRGSQNPISPADRRYRFFRIVPYEPKEDEYSAAGQSNHAFL